MTRDRLTQLLLLAALPALTLALCGRTPVAQAQQAGGPQLFALTAPGQNQGHNVLFVIDPETTRLLVYEHRTGGGKGSLQLVAVRSLADEREFLEWPDPKAKVQMPSVAEIRKALEEQRPK